MLALLHALLEPSAFTPHGFCLLWDPGLLWLHTLSDALIGLAYFSIPLALLRFVRRRKDFEFGWVLALFAAFILACGTTHFLSILTLWAPVYWLEGVVKLFTAVVSVITAALLWPLLPRVLALPSPAELRLVNAQLQFQIQERDRSDAVLREREVQLRQAQKMEGLGQLAGGIAHDFNNVLQIVIGGLTLILRKADDPGPVMQLAQMAREAAVRGASITGRLLAFTRSEALHAARIETGALVEGLAEMLTHTLGGSVRVLTAVAPGTPALLADKAQLQTVIVNLAINARDAMPGGGRLTIAARGEIVRAAVRHRAGLQPGRYVRISVGDTGTGMPPETLARAGEPFFTTKPPGEGTGLGLAMARGFTQQSGGGYALHSVQGQGTKVTLWLPEASRDCSEAVEAAAAAPSRGAAGRMAGLRILLVDDDQMVRAVLGAQLRDLGCAVQDVAGGAEALAALAAGLEVDVLVTDFSMHAMDGLTLVEHVADVRPGLPSVLVTGYADATLQARLAERPRSQTILVRKPVTPDDLIDRIMQLLEDG